MDRQTWKEEKQRVSEQRMDSEWAPVYDETWGAIDTNHRRLLEHFLDRCVPRSRILDAACGTGKYWRMILNAGYKLAGIDRSAGMLARAKAKFPQVPTRQMPLQALDDHSLYAGVVCVDAMESLFPEDWLPVLKAFHGALVPAGVLYFTVERLPETEIAEAFADGQRQGLPLVYGEYAPEGTYHYYTNVQQVKTWVTQADFELVEEGADEDYLYFIAQKAFYLISSPNASTNRG